MAERLFINGEWCDASSGSTFDNFNPATQQEFAQSAAGTATDMARAIEAAHAARISWRATPHTERANYLLKAADVVLAQQADFAKILIEEGGSILRKAMFETGKAAAFLREAAGQAAHVGGEVLPSSVPGKTNMVLRQPVGVVGVISPWNFPLLLSMRGVAFALAYGNTVVLKPSEETPIGGGTMLAKIFEQVELPAGVFNVVTCARKDVESVGDALVAHPAVKRISFTGSTATGRALAQKAGKHLKRIALELGGKDPLIVLEDADLDYAVNAAAFGSFFHQGQICMAVERLLVQQSIMEPFAEKLAAKAKSLPVGDPASPDTVIGPIINQAQLDKIKTHTEGAIAAGATALCGASHEGLFYQPTVLTNVNAEMDVFCEETFGPIAPILPVRDVDEAIAIANSSRYGLSAGILTSDLGKGLEIADQLESGMVHVNDSSLNDEPHLPFGGVKDSGMGHLGGKASMEELTELRVVSIQRKQRPYPI